MKTNVTKTMSKKLAVPSKKMTGISSKPTPTKTLGKGKK